MEQTIIGLQSIRLWEKVLGSALPNRLLIELLIGSKRWPTIVENIDDDFGSAVSTKGELVVVDVVDIIRVHLEFFWFK